MLKGIQNKRIFTVFTVIAVSYAIIAAITPTEESVLIRYGLSETEATLLELTVTVPIIAIWFVAYYGWNAFSKYTNKIQSTAEGGSFQKISIGLLALVFWLPLNTVLSSLFRNIYEDHDQLAAPLVIITNYVTVLILLIATIYLSKGAAELRSNVKNSVWRFTNLSWILYIALGTVYVYVTISNPYRQFPGDVGTASYYLPDWLLVVSIIIPYLVIFFLGLRAIQDIHSYTKNVKGVIYKNALKNIANGLAVSILALLAIRYVVSMNGVIDEAALKVVLLLIYLLLAIIGIGFWMLARGAKGLHKIEDV